MKRRYLLAFSIGLICSYSLAASAVADRVETRKEVTRGTQNSKPGTFLKYYQDTYRYEVDQAAIIALFQKELGRAPTTSELNDLIAQLTNGTLTGAQLEANIAALKITQEFRAQYISNNQYDGISSWSWNWGSGPNASKGMRDWNFGELQAAFGSMVGWKMNPYYGTAGLNACQAPQTARCLGEAYRFLKLAEKMEQGGIPSIPDPIVFSIQADDGVIWDYSSLNYVNVSENHHLNTLPNIASEYFPANNNWNQWTNVKRFTITNLTPQLARQIAQDLFSIASHCGSPIALDLNHDGKISVTGVSSAKRRELKNGFVAEGSVMFDLTAKGKKARYEWLKGSEDGFLVNDREGLVSKAVATNGEVDGHILFGNAGGYENGYFKLAKMFDHGVMVASAQMPPAPDGTLKGKELEGLKVWVDRNHDAKVQGNELMTLESLGITEIASSFKYARNQDGEMLMRSTYVQNGKPQLSEDVWFAIDPSQN